MDTPVSMSQRLTFRHKLGIIVAQFFVVTPHISHLPVVLSLLSGLLVLYLFYAYKYKKRDVKYPRWSQAVVVIVGVTTILLTYRTLLGVDAGVAFLLLCLLGKLLELKSRRDAYIALTLSLFVVSGLFLFEQGIVYTLAALAGILAVLWAMVAQNMNPDYVAGQEQQGDDNTKDAKAGRSLLVMLARLMLQAVPLLIILFIFFPRIPPLWSVPIPNDESVTGMGEDMSPGDFASLSQSAELAFRVLDQEQNLIEHLPPKSQLYWRAATFSHFDGKTWSALKDNRATAPVWFNSQAMPQWFMQNFQGQLQADFKYKVLMQPTYRNWLYALDTAYSTTANTGMTREYNLRTTQDIYQSQSFDFMQLKSIPRDVYLPDWLRQANLQLPQNSNPKSRNMAQQVLQNLGGSQQAYIEYWLKWIRQENFAYTLEPPLLSGDRVDQFLFQTRRGFCEHYASAYTFLMRAAGIPARVVAGYQGGEFSPDKQSWEVRQMDAHAWVEVWLPGQGWRRIDPTAAIAPERVELGMRDLMQRQDRQLFGSGAFNQLKYNQMKWLTQMRVWSDYASYIWQRDVVGFDQSAQEGFLQRLLGINSLYAQVVWLVGLMVAILASIVGWLWWKRRRVWHPLDVPLQKLSARLSRQQLNRLEQEGMIDWLNRLSVFPEYKEPAQQLIRLYQQARYSEISPDAERKLGADISRIVRHWPKVVVQHR